MLHCAQDIRLRSAIVLKGIIRRLEHMQGQSVNSKLVSPRRVPAHFADSAWTHSG
jgi:hypothetical protein